jgi:hypothetical protein
MVQMAVEITTRIICYCFSIPDTWEGLDSISPRTVERNGIAFVIVSPSQLEAERNVGSSERQDTLVSTRFIFNQANGGRE